MDAIAAEAGVSKLTIYSHFHGKEFLFAAAVRARSEEQMPEALFDANLSGPIRDQLTAIAHAFFSLITSADAIALNRLLTAIKTSPKLAQLFWEAGPKRTQDVFIKFLDRECRNGQLVIDDVPRAASQFFCLLKGDLHARRLCGCSQVMSVQDIQAHIDATVDIFLRAYASDNAKT